MSSGNTKCVRNPSIKCSTRQKAQDCAMKRVIVDLDAGTDDAFALLVLLAAEKKGLVKIEAICCTRGNTSVENVCKNVVRILELIGRSDLPIYKGSEEELLCLETKHGVFHGEDGFGDLKYDREPNLKIIQEEPSPIGMNRIATRYPGEIYLICLAPLTNVALAMKLYKNFASSLKEIFIMGGNYKGVGNATKTAEYNFHIDPESAYIVLSGARCPISIVAWETCDMRNMTMAWRFEEMANGNDAMMRFLNEAEKSVYRNRMSEYWTPCDAFLAIALIYPESIEMEATYHATVELHGRETRGQVVLDHLKQNEPNVRIIKRMRKDLVKEIIYRTSKCGFVSENK